MSQTSPAPWNAAPGPVRAVAVRGVRHSWSAELHPLRATSSPQRWLAARIRLLRASAAKAKPSRNWIEAPYEWVRERIDPGGTAAERHKAVHQHTVICSITCTGNAFRCVAAPARMPARLACLRSQSAAPPWQVWCQPRHYSAVPGNSMQPLTGSYGSHTACLASTLTDRNSQLALCEYAQAALEVQEGCFLLNPPLATSSDGIDFGLAHGAQWSVESESWACFRTWLVQPSMELWPASWLPEDVSSPGCTPASHNIYSLHLPTNAADFGSMASLRTIAGNMDMLLPQMLPAPSMPSLEDTRCCMRISCSRMLMRISSCAISTKLSHPPLPALMGSSITWVHAGIHTASSTCQGQRSWRPRVMANSANSRPEKLQSMLVYILRE